MEVAVQILFNTFVAGAIYALVAIGFNLIYSTARFFDVGYAGIAIGAAYVVLYTYKTLQFPLVISIACGVIAAGGLGWVIEKTIYKPLRVRKASNTVLLVASIGVLTVLQSILALLFTSQFQTLSRDIGSLHVLEFGGGAITETQVIIIVTAIILMCAVMYVLRYSLFGKAIRAIADDEEVARIVGIPSERLIGFVFFLGSAIGGVAGIASGFDSGVHPTSGLTLVLEGIIAAIIGGIGNVGRGVLGALLLAAIENVGVWLVSGEWRGAIAFAVLILVLLFRPRGIFST
ncbi:MAG TPA: branched-chain amino acid ABC transporter permease [Candidatus Paceibacterota bacterium]